MAAFHLIADDQADVVDTAKASRQPDDARAIATHAPGVDTAWDEMVLSLKAADVLIHNRLDELAQPVARIP